MNLPRAKIESKSVNNLSTIVDNCSCLVSDFHKLDKEMAWDGYIWLYDNPEIEDKNNLLAKIPVQIKGHYDKENSYVNKKRITYPVDITDLEIYFKDMGALYFEIFISDDQSKIEVFYSSLFPSKLKTYIERAHQKGNRKNLSIPFTRLEKEHDDMQIIVQQFYHEMRKQGPGVGQIVQNAISIDKLKNAETITLTAIGVNNEYDFMRRVSSGDVSLYGKVGMFEVPIEWNDDSYFIMQKEIHQPISIGDKVYYDKFWLKSSKWGNQIILSENLQFDVNESGKYHFKANTDIWQIAQDARFILNFWESGYFLIGTTNTGECSVQMPEDLKKRLSLYIELADTLKEIEFSFDDRFEDLSEDVIDQLFRLVGVKHGSCNNQMNADMCTLNWKIKEKYYPIVIYRQNGEISLFNALYTKKFQTFMPNDTETEHYIVPLYSHVKPYVMANLYIYDWTLLYEQINRSQVNQWTKECLNFIALDLITAYDKSGNAELLNLAMALYKKMEKNLPEEKYLRLNIIQIKKRQNVFGKEDNQFLINYHTEDESLQFGVKVLMDDINSATEIWQDLPQEKKDALMVMPIFHLYKLQIDTLS